MPFRSLAELIFQGDRTRAAKSPLVRFEADILAAGRGLHFNPGLSLLSPSSSSVALCSPSLFSTLPDRQS